MEVADRIDKHLSWLSGITVKRDVRDISSWKSIREFMKGIRQQECGKLEAAINGLDPANAAELAADLKRYRSIASSMGEFLSMVADRNNPDIQEVELQIEKVLMKD